MPVSKVIDSAVEAIHASEERKKSLSKKFFPLKERPFPASMEGKLVFPVGKWVPEGKIGGVDSGFVAKRLASVDIVLIRAVGVLFTYSKGKLVGSDYFPGFFRFPEPHLSGNALEEDEAEQSKSLMRLREEVNASKKIIENHSPDYCFIDGSIIPQYQDKPRKDSKLTDNYRSIIHEFESLYSLAEEKNCTLVATVEDSRGSRFVSMLGNAPETDSLEGVYDSAFLDYFLARGERTCAFTYTKNISQHPVLSDFSDRWSSRIHALYVKPSDYDRPLRVEFISNGDLAKTADEVSRVALALSSLHREYAYPSVLIEADLRAKLKPDEIEVVFSKIMDKLGNSVKLKMRRDNRPF